MMESNEIYDRAKKQLHAVYGYLPYTLVYARFLVDALGIDEDHAEERANEVCYKRLTVTPEEQFLFLFWYFVNCVLPAERLTDEF